jgi:hypothetical protein
MEMKQAVVIYAANIAIGFGSVLMMLLSVLRFVADY